MIACCCPDLAMVLVIKAATRKLDISFHGSTFDVDASLTRPDALLIAFAGPLDTATLAWLHVWRRHHIGCPILAIVSLDARAARQLLELPVDDVLWTGEDLLHLEARLSRLVTFGLRLDLASRLDDLRTGDRAFCLLLRDAAGWELPPRSVQDLAKRGGLDISRLNKAWRATVGPDGPRLLNFVHWLQLLRALELRSVGERWPVIAHRLRVSELTLYRCRRGLGYPPSVSQARACLADLSRHVVRRLGLDFDMTPTGPRDSAGIDR